MDRVAMLVVVAACYRGGDSPPAAKPSTGSPRHPAGPELTCPEPGARKLRGVDPAKGGYLVLEHDGELEAARTAMAAGAPYPTSTDNLHEMRALFAAIDDMRSEIEQCMVEADGAHPALQYQLGMALHGNSVSSMIENVTLQRIDGEKPDHSPALATTDAEPCVKELLTRIELPPGPTNASGTTIVRQDFCTPTVDVARRMTRSYVDVYLDWWREHRAQECPARLAELAERRGDLLLRDPWQEPYVMRCNATGFQVLSAGPDRKLGTADDLESHR